MFAWRLRRLTPRGVVMISILYLGFIAGCTRSMKQHTAPRRDINAVLADHYDELLAIPGVVGIYVGLLSDEKTPCLKVMLGAKRCQFETPHPAHAGRPSCCDGSDRRNSSAKVARDAPLPRLHLRDTNFTPFATRPRVASSHGLRDAKCEVVCRSSNTSCGFATCELRARVVVQGFWNWDAPQSLSSCFLRRVH